MAYIYKITNDINDKIYIGKTEYSIERRFQQHCNDSKRERCEKRPLYDAMNKYGIEHFHIELIEETNNPNEREIYWIKFYNSYHEGYNATLGGDGTTYLELNEEEICNYYKSHSLRETAKYFKHDALTIKNILIKNNVTLKTASESLSKKVAKIDKNTGEILEIYNSTAEAEAANGNTHHISEACIGKRKICKGFMWKYI